MTRRLLFLLLLSASTAWAEALKVSAEPEGDALRIRVESALPERAVLTVSVEREVGVIEPRFVAFRRIPDLVTKDGALEVRCEGTGMSSMPGRYRVTAEYEPELQYPEVAAQVASAPAPGNFLLESDVVRRPYLESILKEQAFLEQARADVLAFLTELSALQDRHKADPKDGIQAWAQWRAKACPAIRTILTRSQDLSQSLFPETAAGPCCRHLTVLLEWEGIRFAAAQAGGNPRGRHNPYYALERLPVSVLDAWKATLLKESVLYRLSVMNALAGEGARERARSDPERWARLRASWEETLALAETGLPSAWKEKVCSVARALRTWWDTGAEKDLAKLKEAYLDLDRQIRAADKP